MVARMYRHGLQGGGKQQQHAESNEGSWLEDQTTTLYRASRQHVRTGMGSGASIDQDSGSEHSPSRGSVNPARTSPLEHRRAAEHEAARRSTASWLRAASALVGLVLAVLLGRALLERQLDEPQVMLPSLVKSAPSARFTPSQPPRPTANMEEPATAPLDLATTHEGSNAEAARVAMHSAEFAPKPNAPAQTRPVRTPRGSSVLKADDTSSTTAAAIDNAGSRDSDPPIGETRPGTLHIDSTPSSQVFIDDQLIGATPQRAVQVEPGLHSVRLYNSDLNVVKVITLRMQPGEEISRVERLEQ